MLDLIPRKAWPLPPLCGLKWHPGDPPSQPPGSMVIARYCDGEHVRYETLIAEDDGQFTPWRCVSEVPWWTPHPGWGPDEIEGNPWKRGQVLYRTEDTAKSAWNGFVHERSIHVEIERWIVYRLTETGGWLIGVDSWDPTTFRRFDTKYPFAHETREKALKAGISLRKWQADRDRKSARNLEERAAAIEFELKKEKKMRKSEKALRMRQETGARWEEIARVFGYSSPLYVAQAAHCALSPGEEIRRSATPPTQKQLSTGYMMACAGYVPETVAAFVDSPKPTDVALAEFAKANDRAWPIDRQAWAQEVIDLKMETGATWNRIARMLKLPGGGQNLRPRVAALIEVPGEASDRGSNRQKREDREREAYELRAAGKSWRDIAEIHHITTGGVAARARRWAEKNSLEMPQIYAKSESVT